MSKNELKDLERALKNEIFRYPDIEHVKIKFFELVTGKNAYLLKLKYYRYRYTGNTFINYRNTLSPSVKRFEHNFFISFEADDIDLERRLIDEFEHFNSFAEMRDKIKDNNAENRVIKDRLKWEDELKENSNWRMLDKKVN